MPRNWRKYIFHRGLSLNFQSILGNGLIPGGEERDKDRQAVFLTPTNPFGNDLEEEEPHDENTVPQKIPYVTRWKHVQDAVFWDLGLELWQRMSFAIMTYATIPGDCIDRVTSQNGDRVNFKRLETPRPAPKVTLQKKIGRASSSIPLQAQTNSASGNWGQKRRPSWSTRRYGPVHRSGTWMWIHISVTEEVSTNALLKSEAVREELTDTNTQAIERVNIHSNKS